jgi:H+/Cl- antiporter ClcA
VVRVRQALLLGCLGLVSLGLSYLLYAALVWTAATLWRSEPGSLWQDGPPDWCVVTLPTLAGAAVYALRRWGADGHPPLAGLQLGPVPPRRYPSLVGAIAVGMVCGIALGPESALLTTAGFLGAAAAARFAVPEKRAVSIAALCALAALFVGPLVSGGVSITVGDDTFAPVHLLLAMAAGMLVAAALSAVRFLAGLLQRLQPPDAPSLWLLVVGGAAIGVMGIAYRGISGETVALALTSGEQMISQLVALGSLEAIALAVLAKAAVYTVSLGAGFRGGAYFPAVFIGAGVGAALALLVGLSVEAGAAAGLVAAVTHLAQVKWVATAALGAAVGVVVGGSALLPACVIAALAGRLIPLADGGTHATVIPGSGHAGPASATR